LHARAKKIEREMGANASFPKGPRVIDLDILLFGERPSLRAELEIPHPRMAERRFVLEPLAELDHRRLKHPQTRALRSRNALARPRSAVRKFKE
jgi:2-amino-4-hydroxy-6-hydroxymethyldihydropteridine diphosphokinase